MHAHIIDLDAADHAVASVTIFSSSQSTSGKVGSAEVVRTFALELLQGENRVHVHGLSSKIDFDSVRVSGLNEDVRVLDLVSALKQTHRPLEGDPRESLRLQWQKLRVLEQNKRTRGKEADMLDDYGMSLKDMNVGPEHAIAFLTAFVEKRQENAQATRVIDEEIVEAEREIDRLQDLVLERKGGTDGDVSLVLHSKTTATVELRLTYLVQGASWRAVYDLYATTEDGQPSQSVNLHFRARVSQSTGEDWTGTILTLSTAAFGALGHGLPRFQPLTIVPILPPESIHFLRHVMKPPPPAPLAHRAPLPPPPPARRAVGTPGTMHATPNVQDDDEETVPAFESSSLDFEGDGSPEPRTVVSESPFSHTYRVEGKSAIPSDGRDHQVLVAVLPFEANISYVAFPRVQAVAYVQCEVKNTSEYRLLPGTVNVFMDDKTVSRTEIRDVNINDTFECTLGADPSIRLTFTRTAKPAKVEGGAFAEPTRTVGYVFTTTIKNTHRFDLPRVLMRDSVPVVGDDKRIRVVLQKPANLAEAKEGEKISASGAKVMWGKNGVKEGKIEWIAEVKSGAEVKLETEFDVRSPADSKWQLKLDP